jgi:hypothetical protein
MKLLAGAAVLLAIGVGLGTYFALRGSAEERPPAAQRNVVLDAAVARGVIDGYHVIPSGYEASGGEIQLRMRPSPCGANHPRPNCLYSAPFMFLEYKRPAEERAQAILRIAQAKMPNATIKFYEITTLDSHTPDARIMLIPKAGA